MAHNAVPAFTKNGVIGAARLTAANTSSAGDGTIGTNIFKLLTADATNGTYVEVVRCTATSSTANNSVAATVVRVFGSSVTSGATTNANTFLVAEATLPATTAASSSTASNPIDIPLGFRLPAGWALHATVAAAPAANAAWVAMAIGGDY